jgi:hypothetical protein
LGLGSNLLRFSALCQCPGWSTTFWQKAGILGGDWVAFVVFDGPCLNYLWWHNLVQKPQNGAENPDFRVQMALIFCIRLKIKMKLSEMFDSSDRFPTFAAQF